MELLVNWWLSFEVALKNTSENINTFHCIQDKPYNYVTKLCLVWPSSRNQQNGAINLLKILWLYSTVKTENYGKEAH